MSEAKTTEEKSKDTSSNMDKLLDLSYNLPEYEDSKYLYFEEWGGVDKILKIEKEYDEPTNPIYDNNFELFWKYYVKNMVDFDSKANIFKKKFEKVQIISILFTMLVPQIITFIAMMDWSTMGNALSIILTIPIPLSFLAAFFISFLELKKFEQLFRNYRTSCEQLKSAAFRFQFNTSSKKEIRKKEFIRDVITTIETYHVGFEGIFTS
jgi:hypothetical protein